MCIRDRYRTIHPLLYFLSFYNLRQSASVALEAFFRCIYARVRTYAILSVVIALTLRLLEGQQCATKFVHNVSWTYIANKQIAAKCSILPCTFQNQEVNDMTYSTGNTFQIATWVAGQISTFRFSVRHYEIKRISQAKKSSPCILMCLSRVNLPRYKVYAL